MINTVSTESNLSGLNKEDFQKDINNKKTSVKRNNHRHPLLYISPQISPYSPNLSKKKQLSPNRLEKSTENIYLCYLKLNNKYHSSFNHKTAKRKR